MRRNTSNIMERLEGWKQSPGVSDLLITFFLCTQRAKVETYVLSHLPLLTYPGDPQVFAIFVLDPFDAL